MSFGMIPLSPDDKPDSFVLLSMYEKLDSENANLRERITTQKQTIQEYRDESREWREVAERAQAENAKLRELVAEIYEDQCDNSERWRYRDRMRELGIEVGQ